MKDMNNYTKGKISKLANIFFSKRTYPKNGTQFIASLYTVMPNANEKILQKLRTYPGIADPHNLYSDDEISLLQKNFEYIFREYHSHLAEGEFYSAEASDLDICISSLLKPSSEKTSTFIPYTGLNYILQNNSLGNYDIVLSKLDDPLLDIAEETLGINPVTRIMSIPADYIESSLSSGKRYNNIIAIPLFFADPDDLDLIQYSDGLAYELINMTGMLENGGQMVVLIKDTACHNRELRKFRQHLVDNSNTYKTTIVRVPISNATKKVNACLVLVEKATATTYRRPICMANLDHSIFKTSKGKNAFTLNVSEIIAAVHSEDPQYFIKRNPQDFNEDYDFQPTHYTVLDEDRLEALIKSYTSKGLFDESRGYKSLIASLYALIKDGNQQYVETLKPLTHNLANEFSTSNLQFLLQRFRQVVEYCNRNKGSLGEDEELTDDYMSLIQALCDNSGITYGRDKRLLLPFGDIRLAAACPDCRINSIERTKSNWAISNIVKEALELDAKIVYSNRLTCQYVDYTHIIARPRPEQKDIPAAIACIIECIEEKLADNGTMAVLLPREACYTSKWLKLREYLADRAGDITVGVISLRIPSASTINEECLFIIENSGCSGQYSVGNSIVMIDGDKEEFFLSNAEVGLYGLKVHSIIEAIQKNDNQYVVVVPSEQLDKGYNFLAARYFRWKALPKTKEVKGKVVHLRDVVSIIPRFNHVWTGEDTSGDRIITHQQLSGNYLACRIKPEQVSFKHANEVNYTAANGGYVAYSHGKMLVGKIIGEPEDRHIGIDDFVSHFTVDRNVTSLDYILKVLSTEDYVAKQARCLSKGYSWTDGYLYAEDLLEIRIVLPSLEEQNKELLEDSKKGYEDKSEEVQRNFDNFRKNMHMQKHKIGQTLSALSSWVEQINYARQICNGVVDDSAIIFPAYNTSAKDIFEKLTITAEKLQKEILALDSSYGMEKDVEDIALADFLDEYISKNDVWSGRKFEFVWDSWAHRYTKDLPLIEFDESDEYHVKSRLIPGEFIIKAGDPMEYIRGTYRSLGTILDNIIANALSHGFKRQDKIYKIKFDIITDDDQVILLVSNNGEPLHERMKSDEVFTYGHTSGDDSHSGIGCYQIKDYMDTLKGRVEIISTPEEEFTVTYKLTFVNANPSVTITL